MSQESTSRGLYVDEFWSSAEFDIEFEFDAPQFYDFSRSELDSETQEIDNWFESSGNYPPSPFSPKINWKLEPIKESTSTSSEFKSVRNTTPITKSSNSSPNRNDKYNGFIYYNQKVKDVSKTKTKSKSKTKTKPFSSNSTLQRPTASLLARQNKPLDIYSLQLLRRCQRSLGKFDDKISSLSQNQDPKRSNNKRPKLTVPKEPNLRTAARSERHKSKVNLETEKNTKSSSKSSTNNKAKNGAIQESNGSKSKMLKVIDSAKRNDIRKINSQVIESKISTLNPKAMQISSQDSWKCPFTYHQNKEEELNQTIPSDFLRLFKECDASMDTSSKDDSFTKPFSQICLSSSNLHTPVPSVVQTLVA